MCILSNVFIDIHSKLHVKGYVNTSCDRLQLSGPEKENVKKEALRLSLKYSFVTPLTSMVVTKPLGEDTDVLHKPKEGERTHGNGGIRLTGVQRFHTQARPTGGISRLLNGMPGE